MKFFIQNPKITVITFFILILSVSGGPILDFIINKAPLVKWLAANHVTIAYNGTDLSYLPGVIAIAVIYAMSLFLFFALTAFHDLLEYMATPPSVTKPLAASSEKKNRSEADTNIQNEKPDSAASESSYLSEEDNK